MTTREYKAEITFTRTIKARNPIASKHAAEQLARDLDNDSALDIVDLESVEVEEVGPE